MTEEAITTPPRELGGCPVFHTDYRLERPALETYRLLNADREASRFAWNDSTEEGFWVINRFDDVREALQRGDDFTNDQVSAFHRSPAMRLIPENLNQPEHAEMRKILNPFFAPKLVRRIADLAQERATALVADIAPRGSEDMATGFGMLYPTELFLALLGLPVEDGTTLMPWVEGQFTGFFDKTPEGQEVAAQTRQALDEYFTAAITDRRANPGDPTTDLVTRLITAEYQGAPIPDDMILTICSTIMSAGLDTTRSALGYTFLHMATHPEDRQLLIDEPELWPNAVEEIIRLYGLVFQDGREAAHDIDFHGLPIKKGDLVWLGLAAANQDPRAFDNPEKFDPERDNLTQHLGFGAGFHRCLGMHLARAELVVALTEWHKHIPHYRIAEGTELRERGSQLRLQSLPLVWD
ncbi:cytochrome P450 [Gordonia liuliyuniae]|uniref:Cytochrome P450 n=1 Tax=Gordonia liuliyuniae TaxID=2911517 RepID=A0ABS9ITP0_9ACTN|nr:cytochrome P450 [Gordonia liuliyuniae]MCF8588932.1 cytochrome P450 [Gordonia liuliyuniae]